MKKQLFIMLATTLIATTFVGCSCTGSKTATDTTTESTVESTTHTKNENTTEPEQPTTTVADIETDSNTESTTTEQESTIEEPTTESPTEKPTEEPTEKPSEKPSTGNQQGTLSILEAYKLKPVGSYKEVELEIREELQDFFGHWKIYRRTYENGAVRDFALVDGKLTELTEPWDVPTGDIDLDNIEGIGVSSGQQPTTPSKPQVVYKGIFPPRSNYSSDEEWKAVVTSIQAQYGGKYDNSFFSSEADMLLNVKLNQGGEFTGDLEFANMSTEEWLKWCEENGFTVN